MIVSGPTMAQYVTLGQDTPSNPPSEIGLPTRRADQRRPFQRNTTRYQNREFPAGSAAPIATHALGEAHDTSSTTPPCLNADKPAVRYTLHCSPFHISIKGLRVLAVLVLRYWPVAMHIAAVGQETLKSIE
jgi:hypothetical protein